MASYFQCLNCGTESEITKAPPSCSNCRSGNGLISPYPRAASRLHTKPEQLRRWVDRPRKPQ